MGPIICLDADKHTKHLALGAGAEVHIAALLKGGCACMFCVTLASHWEYVAADRYSSCSVLPKPRPLTRAPVHGDTRVRPVSVHLQHKQSRLIVSYLNHGIVYVFVISVRI